MVNYYDQVKGPQGDPVPDPYNTKWEDEARADALADSPIAVTAGAATTTDAGDVFTLNGHGLVNGQQIKFATITTTTGITTAITYYVISVTANTFQVSLTPGGAAVALTTNGSVTFYEVPAALVGTPFVPSHFFDPRDGAVTAQPVRASA